MLPAPGPHCEKRGQQKACVRSAVAGCLGAGVRPDSRKRSQREGMWMAHEWPPFGLSFRSRDQRRESAEHSSGAGDRSVPRGSRGSGTPASFRFRRTLPCSSALTWANKGPPGHLSPLRESRGPQAGPRGWNTGKTQGISRAILFGTDAGLLVKEFYLEITSKFTTKLEINKNHTKGPHLPFTRISRREHLSPRFLVARSSSALVPLSVSPPNPTPQTCECIFLSQPGVCVPQEKEYRPVQSQRRGETSRS